MKTRDCGHIIGESTPSVGEAGATGEWRTSYPVIDPQKCTPAKQNKPACFQCWLFCPEAVVSKTIPVRIDMRYCKGCGICAEVCPKKAITMVDEGNPQSDSVDGVEI